ncbi:MAG: replicative DNA helicase, partial [Candidatus Dojkabacteria bacterium]|nr:replicative DNA helicase [Candidatus Dojkabacteria bacterium]
KVPPHNIDAEKSILGAILLDKEAMIKVAEFLSAEHFYDPRHGEIYSAVIELFDQGVPVDLITLSDKLKAKRKLSKVGGRSYLTELVEGVPTAAHAEEYGQIVKALSIRRQLISAAARMDEIAYREDRQISDVLDESEQELFAISQRSLRDKIVHVRDLLKDAYERAEAIDHKKDKLTGIPSGFKMLDSMLGGFQPSDMVVLAARPSVGKSALALDIARHAAVVEKKKVFMFSLEMSSTQLIDRLLGMQARVPFWELKMGKLKDEAFERVADAMGQLAEADIYFDDTPGQSVMEVRTKARRLQMERGVDLVIIDYLQLMHSRNLENRVQEVSEISMGMKTLARELNIPVLVLSQLSRAVESRSDRIPQLSDLRESGSIEQDADVVIFIHREEQYNQDTDKKGIADLIIAKHRNGPTGRHEIAFVKDLGSFRNLEKQKELQPA